MPHPITIYHSANWLRCQRLARGENVPDNIEVSIDPSTLTIEARDLWLTICNGRYDQIRRIGYSADGSLHWNYNGFGAEDIVIDSLQPTPEEISAALLSTVAKVRDRIATYNREQAERAARAAAEKRAADELGARKQAARELLADEFDYLRAAIAELKAELATRDETEDSDDSDEN